MTPKGKAIQLINRFKRLEIEAYGDCITMDIYDAKQCALIAVDEILSNNPIKLVGNAGKFIYMDEYWQQVKTEIEKL